MNLTELKKKTIAELLAIAKEMGLDNMARSRKQDIIFAILKPMPVTVRPSMVMVYSKYSRTVLVFCAHQKARI